ncbi:MAG: DHH family phosphoesterase [Anaerolineae bacterium]|nr:DHH family phosphoesterase [Anaerolineae bacterium]
MHKKWQVRAPVPAAHLDQFPTRSPLLVQVLHNRRLCDASAAERFLARRWSDDDPYLLPDMERAVDVLIRAIHRKERIAVYGDFDADGVTATVLLVQTLAGLGADVIPHIPNRSEGYGLNQSALQELFAQSVRLVVTVDCGIRAVDEIARANRSLEFIVTDHHSVGPRLPPASAVINPKRADSAYPGKPLSGVGVAYKLAQAVIRAAPQRLVRAGRVEERDLLDLVALGTVADLVPLMDENRALVHAGLEVINEAKRPGLRALLQVAGVRPGEVNAATIGFALGPRINAASRMEEAVLDEDSVRTGEGDQAPEGDAADPAKGAMLSYELLSGGADAPVGERARELDELNRRRRALTEQAYEIAQERALARGDRPLLLYAAHDSFQAGVVGLVAGRLVEGHYRPAIVVSYGEGQSRGSCRSILEFDITAALDECKDLLVRHGGHAAAAGFTVRNSELDALVERLDQIAERELGELELAPTLDIDAEVPLAELDWATAEWLAQLEPCGTDNPTPLFLSRGVHIREAHTVGREGQHLKLTLDERAPVHDAIAFRMGDRCTQLGRRVDLVYHFEVNHWNGERRLQLNVQDLRPTQD